MGSRAKNPYKRPDARTRAAKAQGYPARSVFKLEEIDRRARLFRAGQHVLDLGAAPGSWSMYASQKIGPEGRLLAIDTSPIGVAIGTNAHVVQGDAFSIDDVELGRFAPYDVVLSDMAPSTSGNRFSDQARSFDLFERAVAVARAHLKKGGSFVGKLFMSDDFTKAREALRALFEEVRTIRPEGTRATSFEVFLVGLRRKPPERG